MSKTLVAAAAVGMLAAFSLAPQQAQARSCLSLAEHAARSISTQSLITFSVAVVIALIASIIHYANLSVPYVTTGFTIPVGRRCGDVRLPIWVVLGCSMSAWVISGHPTSPRHVRFTQALQAKLDELLRATRSANSELAQSTSWSPRK